MKNEKDLISYCIEMMMSKSDIYDLFTTNNIKYNKSDSYIKLRNRVKPDSLTLEKIIKNNRQKWKTVNKKNHINVWVWLSKRIYVIWHLHQLHSFQSE